MNGRGVLSSRKLGCVEMAWCTDAVFCDAIVLAKGSCEDALGLCVLLGRCALPSVLQKCMSLRRVCRDGIVVLVSVQTRPSYMWCTGIGVWCRLIARTSLQLHGCCCDVGGARKVGVRL